MREHTLTAIKHPESLRIDDSGRVLTLIDDPLADPLRKGDGILGWEGDERLALYVDLKTRTWELWRLEHDNVYRPLRRLAADTHPTADIVPVLVEWLVSHDSRRGFDVLESVTRHNAAVDAAQDRAADDFAEEAARRLLHGLRKDGEL